jgi:predicted AAA+ superfamily ATPase
MKGIPRKRYLNRIRPFMGKNLIKVLVGQRRVGKSYLLMQLMKLIRNNTKKTNIIFINKEEYEFSFLKNSDDLFAYVEEHIDPKKKNYLFIDEVQDIENFEKVFRHYQSKGNIDISCTGSNANLLSGELSTYLSGRYVEFKIYSLSYIEFLEFHKLEPDNQSLKKYMKIGGLPFLKNLPDNEMVIAEYLKGIYTTVIYKDIINRHNIRNTGLLENLVHYLATNIGSIISAKKISDYLKSQNIKTSPQMVITYLKYMQEAFLVFEVKRSDIQGKKVFESNNKYFFEDWGMSNALIGNRYYDVGKTIENVVYINLLIAGYDVKVGQTNGKEIDFIAEREGEKIYIQVSYLISTDKIKQREFGNLLLVKNNYPKFVVSLDEYTIGNFEGIKHLHLKEFLLLLDQI